MIRFFDKISSILTKSRYFHTLALFTRWRKSQLELCSELQMDIIPMNQDEDLDAMCFLRMGTTDVSGRPVVFIIAKNFRPKGIAWTRISRCDQTINYVK